MLFSCLAPAAERDQWLIDMAEVLYTARLFHPVASLQADAWDAAFVEAIGAVPASPDAESMLPAIDRWLGTLHDPLTIAVSKRNPVTRPEAEPAVEHEGKQAIIRLGGISLDKGEDAAFARARQLAIDAATASEVVIDLRSGRDDAMPYYVPAYVVDHSGMLDALIDKPVAMPHVAWRYHSGLVPETGTSSGGYESGWRYRALALPIVPGSRAAPALRFVVDAHTVVPAVAAALERAGRARIEGGAGLPLMASRGSLARLELGGALRATVRVEQVGWDLPSAPSGVPIGWPPPAPSSLPPEPERLFAVLKAWWAINRFSPYVDLADHPWGDVLRPALTAARDARSHDEYLKALTMLAVWTNDGHVSAMTGAPATMLPIRVRIIEGRVVVTAVAHQANADGERIAVGDVVEEMDGRAIGEHLVAARSARAYSTEANFRATVAQLLVQGTPGSTITLRVNHDGLRRSVELAYPASDAALTWPPRPEAIRVLPSGLGYVDLTRLERKDVDATFDRLASTPGIVFDLRGYPRGTFFVVAPHLAQAPGTVAARFERRIVVPATSETRDASEAFMFLQRIPPGPRPPYAGKTIVLIDERAISQSEHTGLWLHAANGTKFVGTPTCGTNGDVTQVVLPGGVRFRFTGQSVRWPDGTQLQLRGLQPDLLVAPTLEGIRAGRDEVLEAGVKYLLDEIAASR